MGWPASDWSTLLKFKLGNGYPHQATSWPGKGHGSMRKVPRINLFIHPRKPGVVQGRVASGRRCRQRCYAPMDSPCRGVPCRPVVSSPTVATREFHHTPFPQPLQSPIPSPNTFIQFIQHDTWSSVYNSEQIRRPGERAMLSSKSGNSSMSQTLEALSQW